MALGDVQSSSINVTGTPVIYHIDVSTNAISEYLTNADGTMWVTDVYAPTYAPADIYITDYASHSVLKVTKSKNVKKYVHLRKSFGAAGWLSAMAPYMIVGDNANGIFYSMNWWADSKTNSASTYYNLDVRNYVVKVTDNRFGESYNRRRRLLDQRMRSRLGKKTGTNGNTSVVIELLNI